MTGKSHTAVNAVSAVACNSLLHIVGTSYSWHQLVALMGSSQLATALGSPLFLYKVTYYVVAILCARLPDMDQRAWIGRLSGGHRGCTHSCLGLLFLMLFCFALLVSVPAWLATKDIIISPFWLDEGKVILEAVVTGWILHILADGLTRGGVRLFWPLPFRLGFPPVAALRFKVGTFWEYLVLYIMLVAFGFAFGAGWLGL